MIQKKNGRNGIFMEKAHVQSYGENGLDWELNSPLLRSLDEKNQIHASKMTLTLYQHGKKSTDIYANKGILMTENKGHEGSPPPVISKPDYGLETGDMYMEGNVVVVSTDGAVLKTDWIIYKKNVDLIRSTAPVVVIRQDSVTKGIGLEAPSNLSNIKIFNQTVTIPDREEDQNK